MTVKKQIKHEEHTVRFSNLYFMVSVVLGLIFRNLASENDSWQHTNRKVVNYLFSTSTTTPTRWDDTQKSSDSKMALQSYYETKICLRSCFFRLFEWNVFRLIFSRTFGEGLLFCGWEILRSHSWRGRTRQQGNRGKTIARRKVKVKEIEKIRQYSFLGKFSCKIF